ncbi:MAG: AIR synthase related protein [Pseudomonadota bacterium]
MSEFEALSKLLEPWNRGSRPLNRANECDAEIVQFTSNKNLAVTTDSLSEEAQLGVFKDPYVLGWISALTSISDLAASGATPVGLLFSANWSSENDDQKKLVFQGFKDCASAHGTFLIGGDQGSSASTVLTSIGLGEVESPLLRTNIASGDLICLTSQAGYNAAFGFDFLFRQPQLNEQKLLKTIELEHLQRLKPRLKAAIDNSDGYLDTLALLSALNAGVQFDIFFEHNLLPEDLNTHFTKRGWPKASFLFGGLGDYNLLSCIASDELEKAKEACPDLRVLARATDQQESWLHHDGRKIPIDLHFSGRYDLETPEDYCKAMDEVFDWCNQNGL